MMTNLEQQCKTSSLSNFLLPEVPAMRRENKVHVNHHNYLFFAQMYILVRQPTFIAHVPYYIAHVPYYIALVS